MTTHFNECAHDELPTIPFDPACRDDLASGRQTMTTRRKAIGYAGSGFSAFGMVFLLTRVEPHLLKDLSTMCYAKEGYATPDAFKVRWASRHPRRGWTPGSVAYLHEFYRVH